MFHSLRGIVLIGALVLNCGVAVAQPEQISANYWIPACRDLASLNFSNNNIGESQADHLFTMGACLGVIRAVSV
jgi:hypothetical protein